jgi:hypothetical protein
MTIKIRRFKCNMHVVLPSGFTPIDGLPNMRFEPGETFDVDDKKCQTMQRYVSGRLRSKDFEEVDYVPPPALPDPAPVPADAPSVPEPVSLTAEPTPVETEPTPAPDNILITPSSPPPKATDPAFTFTTKTPKES